MKRMNSLCFGFHSSSDLSLNCHFCVLFSLPSMAAAAVNKAASIGATMAVTLNRSGVAAAPRLNALRTELHHNIRDAELKYFHLIPFLPMIIPMT
jgi:hypothetical protein